MNVHYSVILLKEWLLPHKQSVVVLLVLWRAITGVRHRGAEKTRNVDKVSDKTLVARTASKLRTNFVTVVSEVGYGNYKIASCEGRSGGNYHGARV